MNNKICLCGFMGCGKTTIGKEVACIADMPFFDTDLMLEGRMGKTVKQVFDEVGESGFRQLEHETIKLLMEKDNFIAALGGGAVLFERNVQAIKNAGAKIIFIDTPLSVINSRLSGDISRPLLDENLENRKELFEARRPIYRSTSEYFMSGEGNIDDLAKILVNLYKL